MYRPTEDVKIPRRCRPKHRMRIKVTSDHKAWIRVNIHKDYEAFKEYFRHAHPSFDPADTRACCSVPPYSDTADPYCICEVNFYFPHLLAHTVAHEFIHAALNVMALYGYKKLIPSRAFVTHTVVTRRDPIKRRLHREGERTEVLCGLHTYFMLQFHDECVRRGIYNEGRKRQ